MYLHFYTCTKYTEVHKLQKNSIKIIPMRKIYSIHVHCTVQFINFCTQCTILYNMILTKLGLKGGVTCFLSNFWKLTFLKKGWSAISPSGHPLKPRRLEGSFSSSYQTKERKDLEQYFIFSTFFVTYHSDKLSL